MGRAGFAALAVALGWALALAGCKKEIYHGLTEAEANEIVVALADHGIGADKLPDKGESKKGPIFLISVDEEQAVPAKRVLLAEQLPRPREMGLMDVFGGQSFIPTDVELKARYLAAKQGELAEALKQVPGFVDAKVELVLPESNPLESGHDLTMAKAAVLVKFRRRPEGDKEADQIKTERDEYLAMLVSFQEDLRTLKYKVKELLDTSRAEAGALVALDTFFTEKRGEDAEGKAARVHFTKLKELSVLREGGIRKVAALPRIADLDKTLAKIHQLESDVLPFGGAAVKSLIAHSTPRLLEENVSVEFAEIKPPPRRETELFVAGPSWLRKEVVLGLAAGTAVLAVLLIVLAINIMGLKKQLLQARAAAAKAASLSGTSGMHAPAPVS